MSKRKITEQELADIAKPKSLAWEEVLNRDVVDSYLMAMAVARREMTSMHTIALIINQEKALYWEELADSRPMLALIEAHDHLRHDRAIKRRVDYFKQVYRREHIFRNIYPFGRSEQLETMYTSILRELLGNPFDPVTMREEWLTSTVVGVARRIADELLGTMTPAGVPNYMTTGLYVLPELPYPQLMDALMDAGCDDERMLSHCRPVLKYKCPAEHMYDTYGKLGRHQHAGAVGEVIHGVLHESDPGKLHHHHDERCTRVETARQHVAGCWLIDAILEAEIKQRARTVSWPQQVAIMDEVG